MIGAFIRKENHYEITRRILVFMKSIYHLKEKIFPVYLRIKREISIELEEDKTVYAEDVISMPIVVLLFMFLL